MTAAGFCSRCGERRDCSGCSCSPIARPYSFLARYTSAAGEIVFQAMHSDSFPLAAESTDAGRAREALALWEQPSRGALKIRAELWDGDAGLWIAGEPEPWECDRAERLSEARPLLESLSRLGV